MGAERHKSAPPSRITERLRDLRESFIEILVVPRVQDSFAAGLDPDAVPPQKPVDLAFPLQVVSHLGQFLLLTPY